MKNDVAQSGMSRMIAIVFVVMFIMSAFSIVNMSNGLDADILDIIDVSGTEVIEEEIQSISSEEINDVAIIGRGQHWNRYSDDNIVKSRFPINYWNNVESLYMPIDKNIYRNYFGEYYWKNAKNTYDVYFKQYSDLDRVSMMFYKNYGGVFTPSSLKFGINDVYWTNDYEVDNISTVVSSEGVVSNNKITYSPFNNCDEIYKITNNSLESAFVFYDLPSSNITNTSYLVLSGILNKELSINIYADGVLWDEVSEVNGTYIDFGFTSEDILYSLDALTIFDSNMKYSNGTYSIENIGGGEFSYKLMIPYSFFDSISYPFVIDPTWYATNTVLLVLANDNKDASSTYEISVGGQDYRYPYSKGEFIYNGSEIYDDYSVSIVRDNRSYFDYNNYSVDMSAKTFGNIPPFANWDEIEVYDGYAGISDMVTVNPKLYSSDIPAVYRFPTGRKTVVYTDLPGWGASMYLKDNLDFNASSKFDISGSVSHSDVKSFHTDYDYLRDTTLDSNMRVFLNTNIGTVDLFSIRITSAYNWAVDYSESQVKILDGGFGLQDFWMGSSDYAVVSSRYMHWSSSEKIDFVVEDIDFISQTYTVRYSTTNATGAVEIGEFNWVLPSGVTHINYVSAYVYTAPVTNVELACGSSIDDWSITRKGDYKYNTTNFYSDEVDLTKDYSVSGTTEIGRIYRLDTFIFNSTQDNETDLKVKFEYYNGTGWLSIPDSVLVGNSIGFDGDGNMTIVDVSMISVDVYTKIRLNFTLSTTNISKSSFVGDWAIYCIKAVRDGSTGYVEVRRLYLELLGKDYPDGGNIIIDVGDSTWSSNPYARFYYHYVGNPLIPDLNSDGWVLIESNLYYSETGVGGWYPVQNITNIYIDLNNTNYNDRYSYLFVPLNLSGIYAVKVVIRDLSWEDNVNVTTRALFMTTAMMWFTSNSAPIAYAGEDRLVMGMQNIYYDAEVEIADGAGVYSGVLALETCTWEFFGPLGYYLIQNKTVSSASNGVVVVQFQNSGEYVVRLTLVDVYGLVSVDEANLTVDKVYPYVYYEIVGKSSPYELEALVDYYFDATESTDYDGYIVMASWRWGDGTWTNRTPDSGGLYVTKSFSEAGFYDVTLTVTDNDDLSSTITRTISVVVGLPTARISDEFGNIIDGGTFDLEAGERITLYGDKSIAGSGSIVKYSWAWGDGTQSNTTDSYASKVYSDIGLYMVILKVENSLTYFDDTYVYVSVSISTSSSNYSDGGFGDFTSLGKNPRLEFDVLKNDYSNFTISSKIRKEGFGGEFLEKYAFKESISINVVRTGGLFDYISDLNTSGNNTTNVTLPDNEWVHVNMRYFGESVNTGLLDYKPGVWSKIYVYVNIDNVWHLSNKDNPIGVSILLGSGYINISFDSEWKEIRIVSNPGLFTSLKYYLGSSDFTPASIGLIGINILWVDKREKGN